MTTTRPCDHEVASSPTSSDPPHAMMWPPPCPHHILTHHLPPHTGRMTTVLHLVPPHATTTTVPHPRLALTHLVRPSTHDDDGASPSRCPHHASLRICALMQRAHWLPRLPCTRARVYARVAVTRAPAPSCRLALSSQSPSGGLAHSRLLADPRSPPVLPRPLLLFALPRPPWHACPIANPLPLLPFVPSCHRSSCAVAHPHRHHIGTLPSCPCPLSPSCHFAHCRTPSPLRSHSFALTHSAPVPPLSHAWKYVHLVICRC